MCLLACTRACACACMTCADRILANRSHTLSHKLDSCFAFRAVS